MQSKSEELLSPFALDLSNNNLNNCIKEFVNILKNRFVLQLNFNNCNLGENDINELADSTLKNQPFFYLNLGNNKIQKSSLQRLIFSLQKYHYQSIDLNNSLSNEDLIFFTNFLSKFNLNELSIGGNDISAEVVNAPAKNLSGYSRLNQLH